LLEPRAANETRHAEGWKTYTPQDVAWRGGRMREAV